MKVCSKCKQEKELSEFNKHKYGVTSWCKMCVRERSRKYYEKNSQKIQEKLKVKRVENKNWIQQFKISCSKCGENHISCLEFHHLEPKQKEFGISRMISSFKNKNKIFKELEKCVVLCSNCHRKLHWEEKHGLLV